MLEWIILGLLFGGAVLAVAITVTEVIRRSNIGDIIKRHMLNSTDEAVRKALGKTIKAKIKSKDVNVVSLDAICMDTGEVIEYTITSDSGVDSSITAGSEVIFNA